MSRQKVTRTVHPTPTSLISNSSTPPTSRGPHVFVQTTRYHKTLSRDGGEWGGTSQNIGVLVTPLEARGSYVLASGALSTGSQGSRGKPSSVSSGFPGYGNQTPSDTAPSLPPSRPSLPFPTLLTRARVTPSPTHGSRRSPRAQPSAVRRAGGTCPAGSKGRGPQAREGERRMNWTGPAASARVKGPRRANGQPAIERATRSRARYREKHADDRERDRDRDPGRRWDRPGRFSGMVDHDVVSSEAPAVVPIRLGGPVPDAFQSISPEPRVRRPP